MAKRHITLAGETHTIAEWCRKRHVNYRVVCKRLRRGLTLEQALHPGKRNVQALTIAGQTRTKAGWQRRIGLSRAGLYCRRKRKQSDAEILAPKEQYLYEAFGRKETLKAWCAEYKKKRCTVYSRMKQGMSLELALTLTVGPNGRKTERISYDCR